MRRYKSFVIIVITLLAAWQLAPRGAVAAPNAGSGAGAAKLAAKWTGVAGDFYQYGIERAGDDIKYHMSYSTYFNGDEFQMALLAQNGRPEYIRLARLYVTTSSKLQERYLSAFTTGYTTVLKRHGLPPKLPQKQEPAIYDLGLAVDMEMQDHNDTFPAIHSPADLTRLLNPYLVAKDRLSLAVAGRYAYNNALAGKTVETVQDPIHTVMLYEVKPDSRGKRWVVFANGNPEQVSAEEWRAVRP